MTKVDKPAVQVGKAGIVIRAPLGVSLSDLLDAANEAYRAASRAAPSEPTVHQRAHSLGFIAHGLRAGWYGRTMTWPEVTAWLNRLHALDDGRVLGVHGPREPFDNSEVRRWAKHWRPFESLVEAIGALVVGRPEPAPGQRYETPEEALAEELAARAREGTSP